LYSLMLCCSSTDYVICIDDGSLLRISNLKYKYYYEYLLYRIAHKLLFLLSSWRRTRLWHALPFQIELLSYYPSCPPPDYRCITRLNRYYKILIVI
ncbi:MAG: hypothetical protein N3G75_04750, partial [Methanothrix sp.]